MKKGLLVLSIIALLAINIGIASANTINDEMQKITYYAQEYETGNINYAQFIVYQSYVRERLNGLLGVTDREEGGILREDQIRQVLGEPKEMTNWVWVEREEREKKLEQGIPVWEKIVFDGEKIQIRLNAYPSLFKKGNKEKIIYRLNFQTQFKKPKEQIDILSRITEIKSLAETFAGSPSSENGEKLAKESVNVERLFEANFRQSGKECAQTISSILGAENEREAQKLLAYDIELFTGDKFEVKGRLELCDDCLWKWINLEFWIETRGRFKHPEETQLEYSPEEFKQKSLESFQLEIENLFNEYISALKNSDLDKAVQIKAKLRAVNDAWNQKSNDVWQEIDKIFRERQQAQQVQDEHQQRDEYFWLNEERERRKLQQEMVNKNYEIRKEFYMNLFANYEKKESYVEQSQFEKRLVEEFKTITQEKCNNNVDDNNNGQIDCADDECGGKFCGEEKATINEGNETREFVRQLFCIKQQCVPREEIIEKMPVCGNNICEANETEACKQDCNICPEHEALECAGKIIFKGIDDKGCQLEPICVEEQLSCEKNEDCLQPLCGKAECIENKCETIALEECRQSECVDGDKKMQSCGNEQLTTEICEQGTWKLTGVQCETGAGLESETQEQIVGNECIIREDCGGENDVCSNGQCIAIPQTIETDEEIEEFEELEETEETQTETNSPEVTGNVVSNVFRKITGFVINAFDTEGGEDKEILEQNSGQQPSQEQPAQQTEQQNGQLSPPDEKDEQERRDNEERDRREKDEQERRDQEEDERERRQKEDESQENERREREQRENQDRTEECKNNCERDCKNRFAMPCISQCVFKDDKEADLEECKNKCEAEKSQEINDCKNECASSCEKQGWFDFSKIAEPEQKQEAGVFVANGMCRKMTGKETEGNIHFSGWGEPFEKIERIKQKFYSRGEGDWCKLEFENLAKQRREIEKGFNQEFIKWFFEKYLASSAEDWEQHVSGIFEMYWKIVENQRELANRMECAGLIMPDFNLINLTYETEYGSIEYWEERKVVSSPEFEGKVELISPYMKVWLLPSKEFIKYEMKNAMKNHEFPGPPEEKMERENGEGPTEEEKQGIKKNEKFMKKINSIADKYGGNAQASVQFKDYSTGEIVFNLYAQVNERDILLIKPMPPEEITEKDMVITIDFDKVYELVKIGEKDMGGGRIESPPWDKKENAISKFNEVKNGIKMFLKVQQLISSSEIEPKEARKDINSLVKSFVWLMIQGGDDREGPPKENEGGRPKKDKGNKDNRENNEEDNKNFKDFEREENEFE